MVFVIIIQLYIFLRKVNVMGIILQETLKNSTSFS